MSPSRMNINAVHVVCAQADRDQLGIRACKEKSCSSKPTWMPYGASMHIPRVESSIDGTRAHIPAGWRLDATRGADDRSKLPEQGGPPPPARLDGHGCKATVHSVTDGYRLRVFGGQVGEYGFQVAMPQPIHQSPYRNTVAMMDGGEGPPVSV